MGSADANGRITAVNDSAVSGQNKAFTYDGLNRLKTASGAWGSGSFTYDALDNIRRKQLGSRVVEIQYNSLNRLNRARDTGNGNAWKNYAYDTRGNVTNNGSIGFTYDWANQPTATSGTGGSGSYVYDGNLKRAKQVVGGKTIYSVYSASGSLIHRDDVTSNAKTDYIRAAGKTIARVKGNTVSYVHQDHLGSPVTGTTAAGTIAWREDFTPYGEKRVDPNGNKDDEGFTGHIDDAATGLTYMQARYYDPVVGRFLSNDPVGFRKGGVGHFNRYAYTYNNPTNMIDPDGNKPASTWDQMHLYPKLTPKQRKLMQEEHRKIGENAANGMIIGATLSLPGGIVIRGRQAIAAYRAWRVSRLVSAHKRALGAATQATRAAGFGSNSAFGKVIGWGGGRNAVQQATSRIGQINSKVVANMRSEGVTRGLVKKWRNNYRAAAKANKGAAVAKAREKLMQKILDNW